MVTRNVYDINQNVFCKRQMQKNMKLSIYDTALNLMVILQT